MTVSDLVIALARCLNITGLAVLAGTLFFRLAIFPHGKNLGQGSDFSRIWWRLCFYAFLLGAAGLLLWIPLQTAVLVGKSDPGEVFRAIPSVLFGTTFGVAASTRAVLLVLIGIILPTATRRISSCALAVLLVLGALLLQLRMGHAAAAETIVLPIAIAAHLAAAAFWFGSLPPLYALLSHSPVDGLYAARRFSLFGMVFVLVLFLGALAGGWFLAGGLPGLAGTIYGNILLIKSALFLSMLFIAALNRLYLSRVGASGTGLKYALLIETGLGLCAFIAASILATQPPGVHENAIWPFAHRLRDNILDDPFLVDAAWRSLKPWLWAALIIAAGLFLPKWRLAALGAGALSAFIFFQPLRLNLFLEEANPASFLRSPTGHSTIAIARGAAAFQSHCTPCHGVDGRGRGPLATGDPVWPPDLTAPLFASRSDGELYWTIQNGRKTAKGIASMPGFEDRIDGKTVWSLVNYLRTVASARSIGLPSPDGAVPPVRAPQVQLACEAGKYTIGQKSSPFTLVTIKKAELHATRIDPSGHREGCAVSDQSASEAYAILIRPADTGMLLIDSDGWIRFRWPANHSPSPQDITASIRKALDKPVTKPGEGHHS
ncbi:c-type cytochrome [Brucellaceae bacterium D45D]